jgi:hypothetical protein
LLKARRGKEDMPMTAPRPVITRLRLDDSRNPPAAFAFELPKPHLSLANSKVQSNEVVAVLSVRAVITGRSRDPHVTISGRMDPPLMFVAVQEKAARALNPAGIPWVLSRVEPVRRVVDECNRDVNILDIRLGLTNLPLAADRGLPGARQGRLSATVSRACPTS